GPVELIRPHGRVGTLRQPGQPERRVALKRRSVRECLTEELRRLDADEIYQDALAGLTEVDGRVGTTPRRSGQPRGAQPKGTRSLGTRSDS
ncbi:MAG: OpcA/G6PD domain-containing protein, partial [Actinomycetes bacterium]